MNQDAIGLAIAGVMPQVNATGLLSSVGTFQLPSGTFTATGFPDGSYVNVAGLTELACQVSSSNFNRVQGNTVKTQATQEGINSGYVMFGAYYPQAESVWRNGGRLVIDGEIYPNEDILLVDSDSQRQHTSALIRLVTE